MKKSAALGPALILCAMAAPVYCSTLIDFSGSNSPLGTITVTGTSSNGTLTGLSGVPFDTLDVSGAPQNNGTYDLTSATLSYDTGTHILTLSGEISALGINSVTALWTGTVPAANITATTNYSGNTHVNVSFSSPTNIQETAIFSALDITGPTISTLTAAAILGAGTGNDIYGAYSEILNTTVATPEPVSFLLIGGGLLMVGGLARRTRKLSGFLSRGF